MYFTDGKYLWISKVYFPAGVAGKIAGEGAFGQIDIGGNISRTGGYFTDVRNY
jgi:hypothetical protein